MGIFQREASVNFAALFGDEADRLIAHGASHTQGLR
jgi:hypothetical protein